MARKDRDTTGTFFTLSLAFELASLGGIHPFSYLRIIINCSPNDPSVLNLAIGPLLVFVGWLAAFFSGCHFHHWLHWLAMATS